MKPLCSLAHRFVDGELTAEERQAFYDHLEGCARCSAEVESLLEMRATAEAPLGSARLLGRAARRRPIVWGGAAGLAAAAVLAIVVVKKAPPETGPMPAGAKRELEARVGPPDLDRFAPYEPSRGAAHASGDYQELGALQRRGRRALVARLLQTRDLAGARAQLESAPAEEPLDVERAVLALLEGKPGESLTPLERRLAAEPRSAQALWNRGLALRALGLPNAAAEAFAAVAALGEPGWGGEARARAAEALAAAGRWRVKFGAVLQAGEALVKEQRSPPPELIEGHRDFVRLYFYDAVRSARSPQEVERLAPLAAVLDRAYGGDVLARYVSRVARADFSRRRVLAEQYRRYALGKAWRTVTPAEMEEFLDRLRAAGASDLLLGALLASLQAVSHAAEFGRLAEAQNDPWMSVAAAEVAGQDPSRPIWDREAILRRGSAKAAAGGLELRRLRIDRYLAEILVEQVRAQEATKVLADVRKRAEALDDLGMERTAVQYLAFLSFSRRQTALLHAYAREMLSAPYDCAARLRVAWLLGKDALNAGDLARARRDLAQRCETPTFDLARAAVLSDLVRSGGDQNDLAALRADVKGAGPQGAAGTVLADVLEGRALIALDPAAGRERLLASLGTLAELPAGDDDRQKAQRLAYQALVLDAIERKDLARALDLLAAERGTEVPSRCAVGLIAEPQRLGVVVKSAGGELNGLIQRFSGALPAELVPRPLRAPLAGCEEVAVVAARPFHGRARVLDRELAWSYRERRDAGGGRLEFRHRVVISDVEPPRSLGLPRLALWTPNAGPAVERHLTGPAATPAAALAAMRGADLVEFHTHGIVDPQVADAAFLALSESDGGDYALTAGQIRGQRLEGRPLVLLAACESAETYPSYSAEWSLPVAFIKAGARAVIAASTKIPDRAGQAFFDELVAKIHGGARPAQALRDLRVAWGRTPGSNWVEDITLFE